MKKGLKKERDYLDYGIVKICQNTERGSGELRRRAVTQTLEEDHELRKLEYRNKLCKMIIC